MKIYKQRARQTNVMVTIISAKDAKLDDSDGETRWYTICETHGQTIGHRNCDLAREWAAAPATWCEMCRAQLETKQPCTHSGDWVHEYDPDSQLGDAYYCGACGELTQVG